MLRHIIMFALFVAVAFGTAADAQIGGPKVTMQGPVTVGHCAQWVGPLTIADAGACSASPAPAAPGVPTGQPLPF